MTLSSCLPNSAWREWQKAGQEWRAGNPSGDAESAASDFAAEPGWPDAGQNARYRAFSEGAA